MATPGRTPATSTLTVNIVDGTRNLLHQGARILFRIFDGNQNAITTKELSNPSVRFTDLPFFDNFGDNYRVVISADGYNGAGFVPVPLSPTSPVTLDLMLLPKKNSFNFANAGWDAMKAAYPFLAAGANDADGKARYTNLVENKPLALASLLNLCTAMGQIFLPTGTPIAYIKQVIWDDTLAQDRFFAYCVPVLKDLVNSAAKQGLFAPEFGTGFFHPGATSSWKQVQFGEANVQLTFHENTIQKIDGVDCIVVEPDIDYFKDPGAHGLLEVMPNKFTGGLTNPETVYALRWMAGRRAGIPEFNPPYTIVQA
jgi:hypothetical protein